MPFELKLQLELAVCDSDIWFMFFPVLLLESVISFLLQKHSPWKFPLAFFLIPCISQAPQPPSSSQICYTVCICPLVYHKCVCFYTFTWKMFHSLSLSTNLEDTNLIYWNSYLEVPFWVHTHRILIIINVLWFYSILVDQVIKCTHKLHIIHLFKLSMPGAWHWLALDTTPSEFRTNTQCDLEHIRVLLN